MRNVTRGRAIAAIAAAVVFGACAAAHAKTFEVTRSDDPAPGKCKPRDCSLREAVIAANGRAGADAIVLPGRKYQLERVNSNAQFGEQAALEGDLDLEGTVRITHPGRGRASIDANRLDRVFEVLRGSRATLTKLVIRGGEATKNTGDEEELGGGIAAAGALTVRKSKVVANHAGRRGGGISTSSGCCLTPDPDPDGTLKLIRSVVARNVAAGEGGGSGGGISCGGKTTISKSRISSNRALSDVKLGDGFEGEGGGLSCSAASDVVVRRSTVAGNRAATGGGMRLRGGGEMRIERSTLSGNRATDPDAFGVGSAGIEVSDDLDLRIVGSTISGNSTAQSGGAIGVFNNARVVIVNSTLAGNRADIHGGAISSELTTGNEVALLASTITANRADADNNGSGLAGGVLIAAGVQAASTFNTLLAGNRAGSARDDCRGSFDSDGGNLLGETDDCSGFELGFGDFLSTYPKLGKLKDNGGPTRTVALRKGSPAIGKAIKQDAPKRDQRGRKRDSKPDIGAFER